MVQLVYTLKTVARERTVLLWTIAFPIVLSTLFYVLFSDLDEVYEFNPIRVIVVDDAAFQSQPGLPELISGLAADELLAPAYVDSVEAATAALVDPGGYRGYLSVVDTPVYQMDSRYPDSDEYPAQSIIVSVLDRYLQNLELVAALQVSHPQVLTPEFMTELLAVPAFTEQISVTAQPPSDAIRYAYACLGFSVFMMSGFALTAISDLRANTSAVGARRAVAGQRPIPAVAGALGASWLLSLGCMAVSFLLQRFGFGINFSGKEPAVVVVLVIGTLVATLLGALLGATPLSQGAKTGLLAFASCFLSLFAGLFGPSTQLLGDWVASRAPWAAAINPVRGVYDALMSLYYYDSYDRLYVVLGQLGVLALVCFGATVLILKRQRHASL